ncbi:MAG: N-acetyltransferase [Rhizorhabdus sp.]|nr:N-acetyltransferase [Rhizorhabdus sp.]
MITIVPLADVPAADIDQLLDDAFGTDRHGRTAYRLREGVREIPGLSFAAIEDGLLIGSIQCWPIQLRTADDVATPLILVGPVAVRPDRQRDGIGRRLMEIMLEAADAQGSDPMTLIGDPEYYDRFFGFGAAPTSGWQVPGPVERRRLLARLRPGQSVPADGWLEPRHVPVALEQAPQ